MCSCDNWNFHASNPCVYVGGNYRQNGNHGLFYVNYTGTSDANANLGSRSLKKCFADKSSYMAQTAAHPSVKISNRERASTSFGTLERPYC